MASAVAVTEPGPATARRRLEFDDFYRAERVRLGKAMYVLTGNAGEAEELLQESMTRALERWDRVAVMTNPVGWVYRVGSNLHRRRFRRKRRDIPSVDSSAGREMADVVDARLDALRLLRSLSRRQLEPLILTEWLGLSTEEAAVALGIAASSVRGRLHRGRATLREMTESPDG